VPLFFSRREPEKNKTRIDIPLEIRIERSRRNFAANLFAIYPSRSKKINAPLIREDNTFALRSWSLRVFKRQKKNSTDISR